MTTNPARRRDPAECIEPQPGGGSIFHLEPGDYMGPISGYTGDKQACFFRLPVAEPRPDWWPADDFDAYPIRHVTFPPHTYRECADGSLEIRASLGCWHTYAPHDRPYFWHGYLDEGNTWREC